MRVSRRGRYALRAMVDLAALDEGQVIHGANVAAHQGISEPYLAHLLAMLGRARLVRSHRGPGGGYALARPAAQISAGDVMRAVDEGLEPVSCVSDDAAAECGFLAACRSRALWIKLGNAIHNTLDSVSLADLVVGTEEPDLRLEKTT